MHYDRRYLHHETYRIGFKPSQGGGCFVNNNKPRVLDIIGRQCALTFEIAAVLGARLWVGSSNARL